MNQKSPSTDVLLAEADDDEPEVPADFLDRAVWTHGDRVITREEALSAWRAEDAVANARRAGRPPLAAPKVPTTIRLDADVLERFRAGGPGWQTRINAALREWCEAHE